MADIDKTPKPGAEGDEVNPKGETPPWGEDFDAERAWRLVTNLKDEVADLKSKHTEVKTRAETAETALADAETNKAGDTDRTKELERELWRERALRKHPTLESISDVLAGDDEDTVLALADRLAGIATPPKSDEEDPAPSGDEDDPKDEDDKGNPPTPPRRPSPKLTPGHSSDPTEPRDLDAIVAQARASR